MPVVRGAWERYWSTLGADSVSPWDADHETQTPDWVDRIGRFLPDGLPLVDLACGSGGQTWMLARRFGTVVGVDVSPTAIERARRLRPPMPGVCFQVLDILDERAVSELAGRIGPANVWIRFLLHHLENDDARLRALASLSALTGGRGRIFNCELLELDATRPVCVGAAASARTIHDAGIRPGHLTPGQLPRLYREARLHILVAARDETVSDTEGPLPIEWVIAEPAG
jgi:hypothetical protein